MFKFHEIPTGETFSFASTTPAHDRPRYRKLSEKTYAPLEGDTVVHGAADLGARVMNIGPDFDGGNVIVHALTSAGWCRPNRQSAGSASLTALALAGYCGIYGGCCLAPKAVDSYVRLVPIVKLEPNGVLAVCDTMSSGEDNIERFVRMGDDRSWHVARVARDHDLPQFKVNIALAKSLDDYERWAPEQGDWPRAADIHGECVEQFARGVLAQDVVLSARHVDTAPAQRVRGGLSM